jgi:hypothetical protein
VEPEPVVEEEPSSDKLSATPVKLVSASGVEDKIDVTPVTASTEENEEEGFPWIPTLGEDLEEELTAQEPSSDKLSATPVKLVDTSGIEGQSTDTDEIAVGVSPVPVPGRLVPVVDSEPLNFDGALDPEGDDEWGASLF